MTSHGLQVLAEACSTTHDQTYNSFTEACSTTCDEKETYNSADDDKENVYHHSNSNFDPNTTTSSHQQSPLPLVLYCKARGTPLDHQQEPGIRQGDRSSLN